jgi:hypothetical protein
MSNKYLVLYFGNEFDYQSSHVVTFKWENFKYVMCGQF